MAKLELTPKQRTLVDTLVTTGCSIKEAAKAAGYSQSAGGEAGWVGRLCTQARTQTSFVERDTQCVM